MKVSKYYGSSGFKIIMSLIMSLCVILSMPYVSTTSNQYYLLHYGLMTLIFFVLFSFIIFKALCIINKRLFTVSFIGGLFMSTAMIIGSNITLKRFNIFNCNLYLALLGFSFLMTALVAILIYYTSNFRHKLYNNYIEVKFGKYFDGNLRYFFIVWIIIFICYIPAFLAAYPGIYSYDAPSQLLQYRRGRINSFVPPLHTVYLGFCFFIGSNLFNSDTASMTIYCISQMLIMSGIFAYCCYFMAKHRIPVIIQIISVAYFSLFTLNQIFAICATKDVIFSGLFLLVVICLVDMAIDSDKFFSNHLLQFRFIVVVLLMFAFRNNGYYVFVLCIPFILIAFKKYFIKMLSICLVCVVGWNIITGPIYSSLNIGKGNKREMLSVPIQQISRSVRDNYNRFDEEEKLAVSDLLGNKDTIKALYIPTISDPEKSNFKTAKFEADPKYYIKNYISIGLKCTSTYIYAFLELTYPEYYPDFVYSNDYGYFLYKNTSMKTQKKCGNTHVVKHSKFKALDNFYNGISEHDTYQYFPVISMLFSQGFMFWILLLVVLMCLYEKRYKMLTSLVMLLGLWISILFGPAAILRYLYPLFVALPIMLMIASKKFDHELIK